MQTSRRNGETHDASPRGLLLERRSGVGLVPGCPRSTRHGRRKIRLLLPDRQGSQPDSRQRAEKDQPAAAPHRRRQDPLGGVRRPGRFLLPTVEPGRFTLTGERAGYARQAYGARGNSSTGAVLTLTAGHEMKDLVFRLAPNAVLSGKVRDEDGDPMASTVVMALRLAYQHGRKQYAEAGSTLVGANGEYSISVTAGHYLLAAVSMGGMMAGSRGRAASPRPMRLSPPTPPFSIRARPTRPAPWRWMPRPARTCAAWISTCQGKGFPRARQTLRAASRQDHPGGPQPPRFGGGSRAHAQDCARAAGRQFRIHRRDTRAMAAACHGRCGGERVLQVVTVEDKHVAGLVVAVGPMGELSGAVTVEGKDAVSPKGIQVTLEGAEAGKTGGQAPGR